MSYRPTHRPTDTAYYRDARTHLKTGLSRVERGAYINKGGLLSNSLDLLHARMPDEVVIGFHLKFCMQSGLWAL